MGDGCLNLLDEPRGSRSRGNHLRPLRSAACPPRCPPSRWQRRRRRRPWPARTEERPRCSPRDGRRGAGQRDRGHRPAEAPGARGVRGSRGAARARVRSPGSGRALRRCPTCAGGRSGARQLCRPRGPAAPKAGGQSWQPPRGRLPWEGRWPAAPRVPSVLRAETTLPASGDPVFPPPSYPRFAGTEAWRCHEPKGHNLDRKSILLILSPGVRRFKFRSQVFTSN